MQEPEIEERLARQFAAVLKSEPEICGPDCLPPERLIALGDHSLPEADAAAALAHVALCARCRREYAETAELLQLSREITAKTTQTAPPAAPSRVRAARFFPAWRPLFAPGLGFGLGAAAGLALFIALTVPARTQRDRLAVELKNRDAQAAQTAQERNALDQKLAALQRERGDAAGLAAQAARLKAENRRQNLQIAQLSGAETVLEHIALPQAAWKLAAASSETRGSDSAETPAPEIKALRPVDTAVLETRPVLEFRPSAGASAYRVVLEMADSNAACPAPVALSATRWQPQTALQPGQVYQWAVTAQRGGKRVRSALAKFYVLSAADRREVAMARQTYAKNPLALGAALARLGLREEAAAQFRAVLKANPAQPVAKRWLKEALAQSAP